MHTPINTLFRAIKFIIAFVAIVFMWLNIVVLKIALTWIFINLAWFDSQAVAGAAAIMATVAFVVISANFWDIAKALAFWRK